MIKMKSWKPSETKAFLLLQLDNELVGMAGWQVENLVARTTDLSLIPRPQQTKLCRSCMAEVERASSDLQCEASLVFPPMDLVGFDCCLETTWL